MKKYRVHEISMGSMADIAFLLLIFFLVATTMDSDKGIMRKLPPVAPDTPEKITRERNILVVLVNREDKLMVEGEETDISNLRQKAKEFIQNKDRLESLPEVVDMDIELLGTVPVTKFHVISLRSDRGTSYEMYIAVQNELQAAYQELRENVSQRTWHSAFADLSREKQAAVKKLYPMKISEAEPQKMED